jgi:hypothetical protein
VNKWQSVEVAAVSADGERLTTWGRVSNGGWTCGYVAEWGCFASSTRVSLKGIRRGEATLFEVRSVGGALITRDRIGSPPTVHKGSQVSLIVDLTNHFDDTVLLPEEEASVSTA